MECKETRDLCRLLEAKPIDAVTYPLVAGTHVPPGWPDRFIALDWTVYQFVGHVEFKKGRNKVTDLQERRIRDLLERGHFACAVWIGDKTTDYDYRLRQYLPGGVEIDTDLRHENGKLLGLIDWLSSAYHEYHRQFKERGRTWR